MPSNDDDKLGGLCTDPAQTSKPFCADCEITHHPEGCLVRLRVLCATIKSAQGAIAAIDQRVRNLQELAIQGSQWAATLVSRGDDPEDYVDEAVHYVSCVRESCHGAMTVEMRDEQAAWLKEATALQAEMDTPCPSDLDALHADLAAIEAAELLVKKREDVN